MKENQNEKKGFILKEKYLKEMEAENLTVKEFLEKRKQQELELEKLKIEKYIKENPIPKITDSIHLNNNTANLGFEKRFFTRDDAVFLTELVDKWEEENSIWEQVELSEEEHENLIQTLTLTGIRYDLKNLGVTIYVTWRFDQDNYDTRASTISYGHISYYYNHFTQEFREINREDYFDIEFSI